MKKRIKFQMGFFEKMPDDKRIKFDDGTISMGEIRDIIKDKGIKPGELFGALKDASMRHDFTAIGWTQIKDFKRFREIIEEVKLDPRELYTDAEIQADPDTKEEEDDASYIPGPDPDPKPMTDEERKEVDYIPDDEPEGSSSDSDDKGEADHIPD